jgi:hypothetical protein
MPGSLHTPLCFFCVSFKTYERKFCFAAPGCMAVTFIFMPQQVYALRLADGIYSMLLAQ